VCRNGVEFGIRLSGITGSTISGNTVRQSGLHGISLTGSSGNTVAGNESADNRVPVGSNTAAGIDINSASPNNIVTGNLLHGNQDSGIQLYNGSNIMVDFKTSNGSALVVGEFRTSLTGQRIVFNPGGALADTMNFYPSAAGDFARIMARTAPADGTAAILIDGGAANGTSRGRVGAYKGESFISHVTGDAGGDTSSGFSTTAVSCTPTIINVWARGQLYFWKVNTSNVEISGSRFGLFWANGDAGTGATPTMSANNAGMKFDVDWMVVTTGTGNAFGGIKASVFTVSSGQDTKQDIELLEGALPKLRTAKPRSFLYREEVRSKGKKFARLRYGVLAEEMPQELVYMSPAADGSGQEKSLNLPDWIGFVHAAVGELADDTDTRLDALTARLAALEARGA